MPSTREQQLARAREARRQQRARERARKRRKLIGVVILVAALAVGGIVAAIASSGSSKKAASPAPVVACGGPSPSLAPATRSFAAEPKLAIDTKARYTMTIDTSCGVITAALEAAKAPHAVNLLAFLAGKHFYDGILCRRSTSAPTLTILQCGDPTGEDNGIGFTIGEENLKGANYTRGTLAMAKQQAAHTTSNQFFLVDKDSQLPPDYTVAGHMTSGLDVLDKLIAVGNDSSNSEGDGFPLKAIYLNKVTVTKS